MQEVVLFYNGLDVPSRQILDSRGAIQSKTATDAKVAIQEWLNTLKNDTMEHLGPEVPTTLKISHSKKKGKPSKKLTTLNLVHLSVGDMRTAPGSRVLMLALLLELLSKGKQENPFVQERRQSIGRTHKQINGESQKDMRSDSNLSKNRASTDAAIRNQGASIKTLEIQIGQMSKSISTIVEADSSSIRRIGSHQYAVSTEQNSTLMYDTKQMTIPFLASHIDKSIPLKEKDPGSFTLPCYINNVCFDNALADLGSSVSVMPLSTYLNLGLRELSRTKLTVELADRTVKYPNGGFAENGYPVDFIILDMLEDIKVPLILGRPFLSTAYAKIDVFKRKITLRVGEEKIILKSDKPASSLIKRVYMVSLRERMKLDLEARLIRETLVLNRSLDPFFGDYIELNDLVPLELRRYQIDDLMPTIEEGEVIVEFRSRNDARMISKNFRYPSDCDHDKKIRIDCAHNLKFSCMIGFEFLHANFFPILYVNVMSKKFYNSIRKDKLEYQGNNVVGALMNIPIFVGTFSILTDFAVLEDMDAYRDEGMGDVIFGEPFLREFGISARRFEGMITIYNGNEEITNQMVQSHPKFKHHTNEQCNKISPLLKVSKEDMMNGISHSYQKLKSFYKGVLNLGPEHVRDVKMEEWLTRGHISVHEME
ncbi:putative reverse transcriptase domain-containing protein [Tanacetum coccineum]